MAQALPEIHLTPADELRALLTRGERRVADATLDGGGALALLVDLDRIATLWPALTADGVDLRPEAGRWETLLATVQRRSALLAAALRQDPAFAAAAAARGAAGALPWWWTLPATVRRERVRRARRVVAWGIGLLAIIAGGFLLLRVLFPVDPQIVAAQQAMTAGDQQILAHGDFAAAARAYRGATEAQPADMETWLRLGIALAGAGDTEGGAAAFEAAQRLSPDALTWRLARGTIYLGFDLLDAAEQDLVWVTTQAPGNARGFFFLASVFEARGQPREALAALARAEAAADPEADAALLAMIRYRTGILLQQAPLQGAAATPAAR